MENNLILKLELNVPEADLMVRALEQLPYYQVNNLIIKIRQQAQVQIYPPKSEEKVAEVQEKKAQETKKTEK